MRQLLNLFITGSFVPEAKIKNKFSDAATSNRTSSSFPVLFIIVLLLTVAENTEGATIVVDPGATGSVTTYVSGLFFTSLNGTRFDGRSESLDVYFDNNKFEVAPSLGVSIDINQSGAIGTFPTAWFSVTGYLMDAAGKQISPTRSFPNMGVYPAQIWPGWPFYLPDGTPYFPATTSYEAQFASTPINVTSTGYYLQPIVFSGIHLDITYPDIPTETVIGGKLSFYSFSGLLYNSPNPIPQFYVNIPESTSTILLLSLGLIGVEIINWKLKKVTCSP
jgi:hypothetical protein